ncbi:MAG TPA: fumarylacetoacetate hydrolase family protein [Acidimicrobiales bacterium]|nr:fumarylacetoacetate hydrolase family protein [Acidimicrobiales bacterium]
MRLARFRGPAGPRLGVVVGDEVVDLGGTGLPADTAALLAAGPDALDGVRQAAARATDRLPLAGVELLAPVPRPPKLLAIGLNYASHVAEGLVERPAPEHQLWFNKQATCVIGPGEAIHVPRASEQVDYEGELAFVVGRRCRHVPAARAHEVVAGFTVLNDVSVRDWQFRTPTLTMGKSFDTHGPLGPWLVTADELGDPHDLCLRTWVNGDLRQDSSTGDLIFDCWAMVEHLTTAFTLEPGDVVATGTPAGVGAARRPPVWLRAGDVVRIEIEGIGRLENPVVDEPGDTATGLDR